MSLKAFLNILALEYASTAFVAAGVWLFVGPLPHSVISVLMGSTVGFTGWKLVAWYARGRRGCKLLHRLTGSSVSCWLFLATLGIALTIAPLVDFFSFRLTQPAGQDLWLAATGAIFLLWTLTFRYPPEIRSRGMQVGSLMLYWQDISRCIVGSDFLRFEARPGTGIWTGVRVTIDAGQKAAVVASLEKLLPAGAIRTS